MERIRCCDEVVDLMKKKNQSLKIITGKAGSQRRTKNTLTRKQKDSRENKEVIMELNWIKQEEPARRN